MKKLFAIIVLSGAMFFAAQNTNAQADRQLNFGIIGVNYEIPIIDAFTIAPAAYTNLDLSHLILGVKLNFYFDTLMGLPSEWDVYGGANAGFGLGLGNNNGNDLGLGLQIGGRWFWSDTWGVYLEAGGGTLGGTGGIGLTMKM